MLLQLDESTAVYPWELLDTQPDDQRDDVRPWAVRTRMLRKLRTVEFRDRPRDARRDDGVLVIGEPKTDPSRYPALPGARDEAAAVGEILGVTPLLGLDALGVVNAVLDARRRILHIAGHGDFLDDKTGGVVLSSGAVFGPREIRLDAGRSRARVHQLLLPGADRARVDAGRELRSAEGGQDLRPTSPRS